MATPTLERRRRRAEARWAALHGEPAPRHLPRHGIVRPGGGRRRGATTRCAPIWTSTGSTAEIVAVGCIGPCYLEPLLDVQMPGRPRVSYSNMTAELVGRTLDALLAGEVPRRHLVGRFDAPDGDGTRSR